MGLLSLLSALSAAWAGCDAGQVDRALEAVEQADPAQRAELAAVAVGVVCQDSPLGPALREVAQVAPDRRAMLDLKAAADAPALWMQVCTGGPEGLRILADLGRHAREEGRAHLWKSCALGERGWFTEAEWMAAKGARVTPFMAGAELTAAGVPEAKIRPLVRALAGVE